MSVTDECYDRVTGDLHDRIAEQAKEIERLKARQQELLQTIRNLSSSVPYAEEATNAATLIAEVGTLRAALKRSKEEANVMADCANVFQKERDLEAAHHTHLRKERDEYKQLAAERYDEVEELHAAMGEPSQRVTTAVAGLRAELAEAIRQRDEAARERDEALSDVEMMCTGYRSASGERNRLLAQRDEWRDRARRDERERIASWLESKKDFVDSLTWETTKTLARMIRTSHNPEQGGD